MQNILLLPKIKQMGPPLVFPMRLRIRLLNESSLRIALIRLTVPKLLLFFRNILKYLLHVLFHAILIVRIVALNRNPVPWRLLLFLHIIYQRRVQQRGVFLLQLQNNRVQLRFWLLEFFDVLVVFSLTINNYFSRPSSAEPNRSSKRSSTCCICSPFASRSPATNCSRRTSSSRPGPPRSAFQQP